ncbi:MAG TPA: hypothetical protein VD788_07315 [Candidatus Polarisedimenticolaceae bacterium]|nr:hypothetical protein [Candidatus Polarisedimenticolaceae bacterium]
MRSARLLPLVLLCLTGPLAAADEGEVYVYTNADLERLGPLPAGEAEPPTADQLAESWAFVQSTIDDAHARIDADRGYELDRRLTEAEADALDRAGGSPRYTLPYNYALGYPYGFGYHDRGRGDRLRRAASRLWERPNAELFEPIVPIHARPYQTNLLRAKTSGRRGFDRPTRH